MNRRLFATGGSSETEYVVYLMYSGGVRTYETWDAPANIPAQWALRKQGTLHREVEAPSADHAGAKTANISGRRRRAYDRLPPREPHRALKAIGLVTREHPR